MVARAQKTSSLPVPLPWIIAFAAGVVVITSALPAEARMGPRVVDQQVSYTCEIPVEPARSVQMAYAEYYECINPIVDEWLVQYPEQVARLAEQYRVWKKSRDHDLRDRREAARFVRDHPIDFSSRSVSLTERQVKALSPQVSAEPAFVGGTFQRFFVDRSAERLFLSTDEEGLVSVDISERYQFDVEGSMGSAGGKDFFVVDETTALMEEDNPDLAARDLVVLDISDRSSPREVHRLAGVLPKMDDASTTLTSIPDRPPTFDEYRAIRSGKLTVGDCGSPPTVSTHSKQRCRPDGTCYREESRSTPSEEGYCERRTTQNVAPPRRRGPAPRGRVMRDEAEAAPAPVADSMMGSMDDEGPGAPMEAMEADAPQGGEGGAGSLSQMMVHGSSLFVLSADHGLDRGWLTTFDISKVRRPRLKHVVGLDNGPEALQRHGDLLLVAGRDALVTASAAADDGPRLLGERRQRCPVNFDPVVVEGSIAYRTIIVDQAFSTCNSRLEVIDLSQPHQPNLRTTERIDRPRGLAVMDHRLFVADERKGVRVFDITDPVSPKHTTTWRLPGVKDLVLSDFDLHAMTSEEIETYYVGPLYGGMLSDADIFSQTTVKKK